MKVRSIDISKHFDIRLNYVTEVINEYRKNGCLKKGFVGRKTKFK